MKDSASYPETATMVRLSDQLTTALRALIDASPLRGLGPIEVARLLGVDKTLASRLMAALRAPDPLAALSALPGTPPLRQFVRAARRQGADAAAARAAEAELDEFDRELQRSFGTRTRLNAVIADALPQARRRHQENARQAVYRGMALIKGVSIDLESVTWVVHPSRERPGLVDVLVIAAYVGARRLRPTARVRIGSSHARTRPEDTARLLTEFCRPGNLAVSAAREGAFTFYEIEAVPVRRDASADVVLTETLRGVAPTGDLRAGGRTLTYGTVIAHASRRLMMNILVHDGVWPGCEFSVAAYDTAGRGMVAVPDATREMDRLEIDAPVLRSRASPEALGAFPVPAYPELLRHVCAPLALEMPEFRMFSCDVVYPIYGAQVLMVCEPRP